LGGRLRVLNVIGSLELAGTEQYIVRVAPLLRRYGVDVEICVLERTGSLLQAARDASIPVHATHARTRISRTLAYAALTTIFEVTGLIRRGHFDVVHSYLFHAELVGTPAARLAGIKRVIISRRAVYPWRRPDGLPYVFLETATNVLANELIANSFMVLRDAERTERLLPRTRTVIYNGVDANRYELARPGTSGTLRLVTVGALAPRKGHEYGLRALRLILDAGIDARLTLVGGGSEEGSLRRVAEEERVSRHVIFAGEQVDPRPFLLDADIFVLPSRQEGFSNALLEAMASGLPAVATDVGGNAEAIVHGDGGAIVAPRDPAAIAEAVIRLARSGHDLSVIGRMNRRRVEQVFSLETSVRNLATWYRREEGSEGARPASAATI
jgi:glycosyltransferase involved in cell wall biosynthesis